ncbi:hypothetical protein JNB91_30100 [Rhizobium wenxiniae]|uniref:hypothetical protein n=1 Tax=Rhizobium wenxiniae TaxID=1737357 RepID=UPI001C6EA661|nr:hypothetical protein [Rhizobium wenxiniae]MBW9092006.1 hypothetical protein [Rhizobium wenxiniae]
MKQLGGASAQVMAPNRKVIFNAAVSGTLNFFDLTASGEPVNVNSITCNTG